MTCIVGLKDKKNKCVWMGADSLGSNSYTKNVQSQPKCFKYKEREDTVIGSTSTFRQIDLLKYNTTLFPKIDKYKNVEVNHEYMVTKFIPNLHSLFSTGFIEKNTNGIVSGGNFVIGVKEELYEIQEDYSVLDNKDGYAAVGCGKDHAYASLFTTEGTDMEPKDRVLKALESAEKFCCGVQRPFTIINTINNKMITVE
jgi:hypothetical protein